MCLTAKGFVVMCYSRDFVPVLVLKRTTQPEVRMARGSKAALGLVFDFVDNPGLNSDSRSLNLKI